MSPKISQDLPLFLFRPFSNFSTPNTQLCRNSRRSLNMELTIWRGLSKVESQNHPTFPSTDRF